MAHLASRPAAAAVWSLLLVGVLAVALLAACGSSSPPGSAPAGLVGAPGTTRSNVEFADYAGTDACARCHADYVAKWRQTPMHNMTRASRGAEVRGPFDGTVFHFRDDSATLTTENGDRFMTIASQKYGTNRYRLTRVIGGHHREDYAGVPVGASEDAEELVLPVSYVYATKSLRYKGWSVMSREREGMRAGPVWNETCIFCHNTVPYLDTVLGALAGAGGYQGEVLDPLLPGPMRAKYIVTDQDRMHDALAKEGARLGTSSPPRSLREAVTVTRNRFRAKHLVEVGIGCESCHLGSAAHAKNPQNMPSFEPQSAAFKVELAKPSKAETINRVCARCHQVLFSGYDPTWEGGSRKKGAGGSHINSGEARDLMLGACATKMSCADCHDVHDPQGTDKLRTAEPAKQDALCTKCHSAYSTPDALRAHSHHDPSKDGARCLNCHMPKKNMSLDGNLSRYHHIGSPTDMTKVIADRPMECALCHVDKSVNDLARTMEKWWKKAYDNGSLERLYGSVDANVIVATAQLGKPHEQAVAFQLLGDHKVKSAVPVLAGQLTHPYPIVRGYAKRALDSIAGAPIAIDIDAPDDVIAEQAKRLK